MVLDNGVFGASPGLRIRFLLMMCTLSHYVLRARSYVVIINTLFYKGILR